MNCVDGIIWKTACYHVFSLYPRYGTASVSDVTPRLFPVVARVAAQLTTANTCGTIPPSLVQCFVTVPMLLVTVGLEYCYDIA
jgi:hypothetical protein